MKTDINIFVLAICCLAVSCTSSRVVPDDVPQTLGDEILFSARQSASGTKSMIDKDGFATEGNCLKIYDAYTPTTWSNADFYIKDAFAVSNGDNGIWPFRATESVSSAQEHYYWTKIGKHRFYSVLNNEAVSGISTPSDWKFDDDCKVFKVPATGTYTLGTDAAQYDFLYSNIVERDLDKDGDKSSVGLEFSHLFSAYAFTLLNDSPTAFKITDIKLKADNVGSAGVDYSSAWQDVVYDGLTASPEVTYSSLSMSPATGIQGVATETSPITVASEGIINLFVNKSYTSDSDILPDDYRLIWPQNLKGKVLEITYEYEETTTKEVEYYVYSSSGGSYSVTFTSSGSGSKDYVKVSSGLTTYYKWAGKGKGTYAVSEASTSGRNRNYNKVTAEEHETVTKTKTLTVRLSNITQGAEWIAGNRYLYALTYSNNQIDLKVTVMQWETGKGGDVIFE